MNKLLSKIAAGLIICQQFTLMRMVPNKQIKYGMLLLYLLFLIVFSNRGLDNRFYTSIGKNGHLNWEWMNYKGYDNIWLFMWLAFYAAPAIAINNALLSLFTLGSMAISVFFYLKYDTFGTMWCWVNNLFLLYFIVRILLIQPFIEYNSLC